MLDRWATKKTSPFFNWLANFLANRSRISPDTITLIGFLWGLMAFVAIVFSCYGWGLILIITNRLCDGLDGALARIKGRSYRGAFLDIVLDFLFYASVPLAFLINDPLRYGVAAGVLLFSFMGTGSSFLAYAMMVEKLKISDSSENRKSFYFLGGITEGTETILVLISFCIFPRYFNVIAWIFAGLCFLTTFFRINYGYRQIGRAENRKK